MAAKAATSTIPIVFANGNDPVKFGLVASFNRPGANVTGVSYLSNVLAAKQLKLLQETAPKAVVMGFLVNPNNPNAEIDTREVETAASTLRQKLLIVKASTPDDIEAAFATLVQQRIGALLIHADALFSMRYEQLAALAVRHAMPAIYSFREFAAAGGLMSYGASIIDGYRQAPFANTAFASSRAPIICPAAIARPAAHTTLPLSTKKVSDPHCSRS